MSERGALISIIIPIYKVEQYLDKCIQSIINQTYKNLQIILVNDGSPDNCGKICDEYALKDNRIEVIHKINGGLSDARNVGIGRAKGKYIGFVDSDDYIEKDMYENMYNLLEERNADVCICNFYNVIENNNIIKNPNNGIQEYNKIGKKYEDIGTTFYILEKCNKVVVTDLPKYYYLNRIDSIVNNLSEQTVIDYVDLINERYDYIENKYSELRRYNIYYLARTLITAYTDLQKLKKPGKEIIEKLDNLYNKSKKAINEYEKEVIDLFDEKQKMQLYTLLYDVSLFFKMSN